MEFDHEADVRERIVRAWGGADRAAELAELAGVPADRQAVAAMLAALTNGYVNSRIAELAKDWPPPHELPPDDPWANWRGDDGWAGDEHRALLAKGEGRPPDDTLLLVYDVLAAWWETLPPLLGRKKPRVWRPEFDRGVEAGLTTPANEAGTVFLFVARRCLDARYTGANCNAAFSRAKDRRRSPESAARRNAQKRAYKAEWVKQRSNPPSS